MKGRIGGYRSRRIVYLVAANKFFSDYLYFSEKLEAKQEYSEEGM